MGKTCFEINNTVFLGVVKLRLFLINKAFYVIEFIKLSILLILVAISKEYVSLFLEMCLKIVFDF